MIGLRPALSETQPCDAEIRQRSEIGSHFPVSGLGAISDLYLDLRHHLEHTEAPKLHNARTSNQST